MWLILLGIYLAAFSVERLELGCRRLRADQAIDRSEPTLLGQWGLLTLRMLVSISHLLKLILVLMKSTLIRIAGLINTG